MTSFLLETIDLTPHRAGQVTVPLLHDIPIIGEPLFVNRWTIYLLLLAVPLSWLVVQRTRWGLELRACGEDPRSEEHTSELQSLMSISYAVFCLKKTKHSTRVSIYLDTEMSNNHSSV